MRRWAWTGGVRAASSYFGCCSVADWILDYSCLNFMSYPPESWKQSPETIRAADPTFLRWTFYLIYSFYCHLYPAPILHVLAAFGFSFSKFLLFLEGVGEEGEMEMYGGLGVMKQKGFSCTDLDQLLPAYWWECQMELNQKRYWLIDCICCFPFLHGLLLYLRWKLNDFALFTLHIGISCFSGPYFFQIIEIDCFTFFLS